MAHTLFDINGERLNPGQFHFLFVGWGLSLGPARHLLSFLPHSPQKISGYCFHPWRPDEQTMGKDCISETVTCREVILGFGCRCTMS